MQEVDYESDDILSQYLLFHYGWREEVFPYGFGPSDALDYPWRCAELCLGLLPEEGEYRALDLGCAVGRSSFELARKCQEVIAIDKSQKFIDVANYLREEGTYYYRRIDEGDLTTPLMAKVPDGIYRQHVHFRVGDACDLPEDLGEFDCVLMANLLCRLPRPDLCLARLPSLLKPGGYAAIMTPSTWSDMFTPRAFWLGGHEKDGHRVGVEEGIRNFLDPHLNRIRSGDMPFLIREHSRKYQWSVARFTLWQKP